MMTLYLRWDNQIRPLQIDRVTSFSAHEGNLVVWIEDEKYIYPMPDSFAAGIS